MKIALINTYDTGGGAAIACRRLAKALAGQGHEVTVLVNYRKSNDPVAVGVNMQGIGKLLTFARFSAERFFLLNYLKSKKELYAFSAANTGADISDHPAIKAADVVHIHWVNQGFLSIKDIGKLVATGKPIVWTLHDMWTFTGGCHYSGECDHFEKQCGDCPYMRSPSKNDLSARIWKQKEKYFTGGRIQYVACSNWLGEIALKSGLLKDEKVASIPNPIDTGLFLPMDKAECKKGLGLDTEKVQLLFGSANIKDERKGFRYLKEALELICKEDASAKNKFEVIVFGKADETFAGQLPVKVNFLGTVGQDAIAKVYNAATMFVIPSLQDNLPNTIMESLACGTPVVGFKTGGIPEMIDHLENGYLSDYRSVADLAAGIKWVVNADKEKLSLAARDKVMRTYAEPIIAKKYIELYEGAMEKRQH